MARISGRGGFLHQRRGSHDQGEKGPLRGASATERDPEAGSRWQEVPVGFWKLCVYVLPPKLYLQQE